RRPVCRLVVEASPVRPPVQGGHGEISLDVHSGKQSVPFAVFGKIDDAAADRFPRMAQSDLPPLEKDRPFRPTLMRAENAGKQLGPSRADKPGKPEHLPFSQGRSEEHTSELQSRENLVCRLLLE